MKLFHPTRLDVEGVGWKSLGNDHGFIIKEYYLYWNEVFWGSPKQSHESLFSKWKISYHCGESCSSNIVSESCPKLSHVNRILKCRTNLGNDHRFRNWNQNSKFLNFLPPELKWWYEPRDINHTIYFNEDVKKILLKFHAINFGWITI